MQYPPGKDRFLSNACAFACPPSHFRNALQRLSTRMLFGIIRLSHFYPFLLLRFSYNKKTQEGCR
ncbi:hypothetical protein ENTCAN_05847 [Enterobacter cancerogenus ATCC 35316]|nr:hypothetical protein ENTCAN_05847 [Enterobacter cancerogenus ATCC 35316]